MTLFTSRGLGVWRGLFRPLDFEKRPLETFRTSRMCVSTGPGGVLNPSNPQTPGPGYSLGGRFSSQSRPSLLPQKERLDRGYGTSVWT